MDTTCSSGTLSTPEGRAAMSTSFSFAMIIRTVEVRGASLASIASFIAAVKRVRRSSAMACRSPLAPI